MRSQKVPELIEFVHSEYEPRINENGRVHHIGVGPLVGCVLARRVRVRSRRTGQFTSAISLGWSQCARNLGDKFDKNTAVSIARGRAIAGSSPAMTRKIAPSFERMEERASRYFQNISWA